MTYKYKLDTNWAISKRKVRCSVKNDLMEPRQYYDPNKIILFAANEASLRITLSITAAQQRKLGLFDIKLLFTAEEHGNEKPIYMKLMLLIHAWLLAPNKTAER